MNPQQIAQQIIDKVKAVFVFGPGNSDDPRLKQVFEDEGLAYKQAWASITKRTAREHSTLRKNESSLTVLSKFSTPLWVEDWTRLVGAASAARAGSCGEHTLLAIFFAAQLKDQTGKRIFDKLSFVQLPSEDHVFVKGTFVGGEIYYIDPWKREFYPAADFAKHNNGQNENILDIKFIISATDPKYGMDEFIADSQRWIDIYKLAAKLPAEQMEEFIGRYLAFPDHIEPQDEKAQAIKKSYRNPDPDHPPGSMLFSQEQQQQTQQDADDAIVKKIKESIGNKIVVLDGNKCDLSAVELINLAQRLWQRGQLDGNCRVIFAASKPLYIGTEMYKSMTQQVLVEIMANQNKRRP